MRLLLLLLLCATAAWAENASAPVVQKNGNMSLSQHSGDFQLDGNNALQLGPNVCEICNGGAVGNSSGGCDFSNPTDFCANKYDASATAEWKTRTCQTCTSDGDCTATTGEKCVDGYCSPTTLSSCCFHPNTGAEVCGNGTYPLPQAPLDEYRVGGDGSDGAFSQSPAASGSCASSDCGSQCASCTGTRPACTCVLTANALIPHTTNDSATIYSCVYNFSSFSLTGGTVTCGQAGAYINTASSCTSGGSPNTCCTGSGTGNCSSIGALLTIRVQQSPVITGGTIDMLGKGSAGGAGGSSGTTGNRAGGASGANTFFGGAAATATGKNNGGSSTNTLAAPHLFPFILWLPIGTGGGGGAGSNTNGAAGAGAALGADNVYAGTGGGGPGCASGTASAAGGSGGRGGGGIIFETSGLYSCSGATFNTSGSAGTNATNGGGGGGGSGSIIIVYRGIGSDTCTYTAAGGSGGTTADSTNCGTSAAGGNGGSGGSTGAYKFKAAL